MPATGPKAGAPAGTIQQAGPKTNLQLTLDWDILDPNLPGGSSDGGEDDDLMPRSAIQDKK